MDKNKPITEQDFKQNRLYKGDHPALKKRYPNMKLFKERGNAGGAFSTIYKATDTLDNNKPKAIKLLESTSAEDEMLRRIFGELHSHSKITEKRPYVTTCEEFYMKAVPDEDDETIIKFNIYMVFEFFEMGMLKDLIENNRAQGKSMSEYEASQLLEQLVRGLAFLQSFSGIFHRDLKPDNIAVIAPGKYSIIDLGESQQIDPENLKHSIMKYVSMNNIKGRI